MTFNSHAGIYEYVRFSSLAVLLRHGPGLTAGRLPSVRPGLASFGPIRPRPVAPALPLGPDLSLGPALWIMQVRSAQFWLDLGSATAGPGRRYAVCLLNSCWDALDFSLITLTNTGAHATLPYS